MYGMNVCVCECVMCGMVFSVHVYMILYEQL